MGSIRSTRSKEKLQGISCVESGLSAGELEQKVMQLEDSLQKFRAEVDMKMRIVKQVLATRNEQFLLYKKLIEREQILHESVLSHWNNISELVANGLSLSFIENGDQVNNESDILNVTTDFEEPQDDSRTTQKSSFRKNKSPAAARRARKRRRMTRATAKLDADSSDSDDQYWDNDSAAMGTCEYLDCNDYTEITQEVDDFEKEGCDGKVFFDYYTDELAKLGEQIKIPPIWKHYLREENGQSALCKLCDEKGEQCILKVNDGYSTKLLHNHLKTKHKTTFPHETLTCKKDEVASVDFSAEADKKLSEVLKKPIQRFDYLFEQEFDSKEDGCVFIRSERMWTRHDTKHLPGGTKIYYHCKFERTCPARVFLLLPTSGSETQNVKLFRTPYEHSGHEERFGIPKRIKVEILKLYNDGITRPNEMLEALGTDGLTIPKKTLTAYLAGIKSGRVCSAEDGIWDRTT